MLDQVSENLAANLVQLRRARGLTQQQVAKLAKIPRPTLATLESGAANPTLAVLLGVAGALQVSLEELIGPPRAACRLYRAASISTVRRGQGMVRKLLPEALPGLELDRVQLPPGARFAGVPHTPGTREYLTCESGVLELTAAGETHRLDRGDVLVFAGDQNHSYRNPGRHRAVGYSVVALAPPGVGA